MWPTIKKVLQNGGGRCIIIENDKPSYVIVGFEDFQSLIKKGGFSADKEIEMANGEISDSVQQTKENEVAEVDDNNQEVKIEDLPF